MTRLRRDERGLGLAIVIFIAMLVIAGLFYALMNGVMSNVFTISSTMADTTAAQSDVDTAQAIWQNLLFAILVISALYIVGRAVAEGRAP